MRSVDADAFDKKIRAAVGMTEEELTDDFKDGIATILEMLKSEPTIEPERKKGKWVLGGYDDMYYVCDQCGYRRSDYYAKPKAKYCENCGADMREGEQE